MQNITPNAQEVVFVERVRKDGCHLAPEMKSMEASLFVIHIRQCERWIKPLNIHSFKAEP